ncbi:hypothetical protein PLESTM_001409300 [Pleodorina starrii]|nr:hypothetical protein PLESTM_001409300 [Pleodorina starrii]
MNAAAAASPNQGLQGPQGPQRPQGMQGPQRPPPAAGERGHSQTQRPAAQPLVGVYTSASGTGGGQGTMPVAAGAAAAVVPAAVANSAFSTFQVPSGEMPSAPARVHLQQGPAHLPAALPGLAERPSSGAGGVSSGGGAAAGAGTVGGQDAGNAIAPATAASTSQASGSHNVRGAAGVTACAGHKRSRDNHGPEGREPRRTAEGYAGRADDAAAAEARGEATAGPRGAAYDNAPPPPPPPPPAGLVERPSSGAGGVSSGGGAAAGAGAVGGQDAGSAIAPANAAEKLRGCGMDDQQMKALAIRIALPEETFLQELRTKVVDPLDADVKAAEDAADKAAKVAKEAAEVLAEAVAKYKQWEETASTALRAEHPDILLAVQGAASMVKPMANSYQEKAYAEGANIMAQTTQFSADAAFKMSQLAARQRNEEWGRVEQFACLRRNALGTQRLTAWSDIALGLVGQMSKEECWAAARAVGEAPRMGSQELERLCIFQERLRQKEDPLCRSLANELLTYIGLEMVVELGKGRRG